jgi:hypothetical protein
LFHLLTSLFYPVIHGRLAHRQSLLTHSRGFPSSMAIAKARRL